MTQTPNPTDGKLTEAEIEEIRNGPPGAFDYVQKLCDMALESLKAPAVTEKDSLIDALGTQIDGLYDDIRKALDELGDPTPCPAPIYQARKILLYALMNGQCPPCDMGENTECVCPAPAPLSSEAVGKALKLANELVESDPRGLSADQHSCAICGCAWVHADSCKLLALKHALALLTPSPNEKEKP